MNKEKEVIAHCIMKGKKREEQISLYMNSGRVRVRPVFPNKAALLVVQRSAVRPDMSSAQATQRDPRSETKRTK